MKKNQDINLINGVYTPQNFEKPKKKKKCKGYKIFIVLFAIIVLFFTTNTLFTHNGVLNNLGQASFWQGVANIVSGKTTLKGEIYDRINILILGMGGARHEGPYLTDTIMLASIKPSTNQAALISIPRDLYIDIPGKGKGKINAVNAIGVKESKDGGDLTSDVVEDILNTPVHYWVRANFNMFEKIINEIGGIEITVKRSFTDYQYPALGYKYKTVSFEKGKQHMNGKKALEFARSRHGTNGENSDFARSKRQQQVIFAVKNKIQKTGMLANPTKVFKLFQLFKNNISTNLNLSQSLKLTKLVMGIKKENIIREVFQNGKQGLLQHKITNNGSYVLVPKDDFDDLAKVSQNIFKDNPSKKAQQIFNISNQEPIQINNSQL